MTPSEIPNVLSELVNNQYIIQDPSFITYSKINSKKTKTKKNYRGEAVGSTEDLNHPSVFLLIETVLKF